MQPVVRAIDVGFGYTKYVTHVEGNAITCEHFPSVAAASVTDPAERSWGGPRDTIALRVDQMFYEAGPDIDLALGNFRPPSCRARMTTFTRPSTWPCCALPSTTCGSTPSTCW